MKDQDRPRSRPWALRCQNETSGELAMVSMSLCFRPKVRENSLTWAMRGVRNKGPASGLRPDSRLTTRPIAELVKRTVVESVQILCLAGPTGSAEASSGFWRSSAAKFRSHMGRRRHSGCKPYLRTRTRSDMTFGIQAMAPIQSPKIAWSASCRRPSVLDAWKENGG